jgi:hypothetical protein
MAGWERKTYSFRLVQGCGTVIPSGPNLKAALLLMRYRPHVDDIDFFLGVDLASERVIVIVKANH